MNLQDLGFTKSLEEFRQTNSLDSFIVGRIASEHKERYIIKTEIGEFEGEVLGNLRFTATSRADFPVVGDWVNCSEYDEGRVLIHSILPRKTLLERKSSANKGEKQPIAANIDSAFIVTSVDRDFSINRIERYLTICYNSKVDPLIIVTKTDLVSDTELEPVLSSLKERMDQVPVIAISNISGDGIDTIRDLIKKGHTYCLLGSSGVGKSTLLNKLAGRELMKTGEISQTADRGKHVTSHRELYVLESGGIIIDNPGMRELGIADSGSGLDITFENILDIASACKYADCTHVSEEGCAVIKAVEDGIVDRELYENYLRLEREKDHYESTVAERRQKDKEFGKMIKKVKNDMGKLGNKPDY